MSVNKVILMGHTGKAPDFKEFDNGVAWRPFRWQPRNEVIPQRTGGKSRSVPNGITSYCKTGWQRSPISTSKRATNCILRAN